MVTSVFIARVLGLLFVITSIGIFINRSYFKTVIADMANHPGFLMIGGFLNLFIGLLIVVSHNVWVNAWPVIITIIGWLLVIRGCVLTLFPSFVRGKLTRVSSDDSNKLVIGATIFLILGVILLYFGYFYLAF